MASKTPLLQPAQGSSAWNEPLNANFGTVTNALGNIQSISVSSGYALTSTEAVNLGFILTGSLGSAQNITLPNNIVGSWIVVNSTSGTGSVTFKTSGGTGVQLSSGATILYSDGTNVYSAIAGSGASYLPTSGGTVSGNLAVTGTLDVGGLTTFNGSAVVPAGKTLTIASGANFALNGAFSPSYIALGGNQVSPYLLTLTGVSSGASMAYMNGLVSIPSGTGNGLQVGTTDGIGSDKLLVNGTSTFKGNMSIFNGSSLTINAGGSTSATALNVTGIVTASSFSGAFSPTTISATGKISTSAAGVALEATAGSISGLGVASTGNITATGNISAGTTGSVSSGTAGITTTGSISASGSLSAGSSGISTTGSITAGTTGNISAGTSSGNLSTGSSGKITIGTGGFSCAGTSAITGSNGLRFEGSPGFLQFGIYGAATQFGIANSSNVTVAYVTSTGNMTINGTLTQSGSDIRLKENVVDITDALDKVKKMRGVFFNFKNNDQTQPGLIAQEVLPILPEVVRINDLTGYYTIQYDQIVGVLINAIKELEARVAALEAKIS